MPATTPARAPAKVSAPDEALIAKRPLLGQAQKDACTRGESLGKLTIGMSPEALIAAYGEPSKKDKRMLYEATGEHHETWNWQGKGVKVDMLAPAATGPVGQASFLMVSGPFGGKTAKGVGIGSTREDVLRAYDACLDRESISEQGITLGDVFNVALSFDFEGASVSSMSMGAMSE